MLDFTADGSGRAVMIATRSGPMNAQAQVSNPTHAGSQTRVMVVDDSAVVRGMISRRIEAEPDLTVVTSASNGEMALHALHRHAVDVVVLDIEMPVMDGLTALPLILAEWPHIKVLVASSLTRRNVEISFKALQSGAADCLAKPDATDASYTVEAFNNDLITKLRALGAMARRANAAVKPAAAAVAPPPSTLPLTARAPSPAGAGLRPEIIVIGGSTGAPPMLVRVFEGLRGHVSQPILLTQHMPPVFTALLAEQLERAGGRPCAEGRDGEPIEPGRAYIAPGGWHMVVERVGVRRLIRLHQGPAVNFCRPAVDPLFQSVAEAYGRGVLGIILTGMGADGARGCEAIARAGGRFAVQDEATSAVWGMPGAAAKTGLADRVLPIQSIAGYIAQVAETGR
jgi:two-component system chemotaxis response regulator CheB